MTDDQSEKLVAQIMAKLSTRPGGHIDVLERFAEQHMIMAELKQIMDSINESFQSVQLIMQYIMFDLEATRRERDELRMKLEDRDD